MSKEYFKQMVLVLEQLDSHVKKNYLTFNTKINWKEIININARMNTIKLLEKNCKISINLGFGRDVLNMTLKARSITEQIHLKIKIKHFYSSKDTDTEILEK